MSPARALSALLAVSFLAPGCAIDKTRRSVTFTMQEEIDSGKERAREIEKDLGHERARLDAIEDRAASARKRLADSGATLETFLDELTAIRGELSELEYAIERSGAFDEDVNLRLAGIEYQFAYLATELGVTPAPMPMGPHPDVDPAAGDPVADPADPAVDPAVDPADPEADPLAADPGSEPAPAAAPDSDAGASAAAAIDAPPGADAEFVEAVALVRADKWDQAGTILQKYLRKNRESEHYLEAQYLVGQCLFELGRYKNAITEFQKVIEAEDKRVRKGADVTWAPRAMLMQGLSFEELGTAQDLEAAALFFDELIRIYGDAPEAERARRRLERLDANR